MKAIILSLILSSAANAQVFSYYDSATGDVILDINENVYSISLFNGATGGAFSLDSPIYTDNLSSRTSRQIVWGRFLSPDTSIHFPSRIVLPGLMETGISDDIFLANVWGPKVFSLPGTGYRYWLYDVGAGYDNSVMSPDDMVLMMPLVPEPSAMLLVGICLVALTGRRASRMH